MLVRVGGRLKRRAKARTLAELEEVLGEELVQARRDANQELVAKLDSELAAARARDAEARAPEEPPEPEPPAPEPAAEPVEPVVEPSPPEPTPTLDVTEVSSAVEPSGGSAVAGWATLGAGSAWAWHAAGQGTGLSSDMDGISMRDQGSSRVRGGRVYVGGGLRGGK